MLCRKDEKISQNVLKFAQIQLPLEPGRDRNPRKPIDVDVIVLL